MRQTPTILVVDDHGPTAKSTAEVLKQIHPKWVVLTAHTVSSALECIGKNSVDAVVTDWKLNERNNRENGFIVIKAALRKDPLCVTILMTAFPGEFDRYRDAFAIGVYDCINKRQQGIRVSREIAIKLQAALEKRWDHEAAEFYARHIDHRLREKLGATAKHSRLNDRFLTVLFADIRGFSRISDQLRAHKDLVSKFLQGLYEVTVESAHSHGGIVDKFMGDGAMLLFGAFDADASKDNCDHARRACRCALKLESDVAPLIDVFRDAASAVDSALKPRLSLGIGINTAPVSVGIIRTEHRDQYTAVGHGVNLASRFEHAAGKSAGSGKGRQAGVYGSILITSAVEFRIRGYFDVKVEPTLRDIHNIQDEHPVWSLLRERVNSSRAK